jgi:hypothetical protein
MGRVYTYTEVSGYLYGSLKQMKTGTPSDQPPRNQIGTRNEGKPIWMARACPHGGHLVEDLLSSGRNQNTLGRCRLLSEELLLLRNLGYTIGKMHTKGCQVQFTNVTRVTTPHDGQKTLLGHLVLRATG